MAGGVPRFFGDDLAVADDAVTGAKIVAGAVTNAKVNAAAAIAGSKLADNARRQVIRSEIINIDIGAGTTQDWVVTRQSAGIHITAARFVYTEATAAAGAAAATIKIGTAAGGEQIVAAANIEQPKAVGTATALALVGGVSKAVAANTPVFIRLTGVVATPILGEGFVELEFTTDD